MTNPIQPGPDATTTDFDAAIERDRLTTTELPRVRAAATAWRNGLAGLLTALIGFGLIKGRSDVTELNTTCATVVASASSSRCSSARQARCFSCEPRTVDPS